MMKGILVYFYLSKVWDFIDGSPILSGLISGVLLLAITALLIPWFKIKFLNKNLLLIDSPTHNGDLKIYKTTNPTIYCIKPSLKNYSRQSLMNPWSIDIIIPGVPNPKGSYVKVMTDEKPFINFFNRDGKDLLQVKMSFSKPLYANSAYGLTKDFFFTCVGQLPNELYYNIYTEFGVYPKSAKKFEKSLINTKGMSVHLKYLLKSKLVLDQSNNIFPFQTGINPSSA